MHVSATIERRPTASLLPYAQNSRTHDDAQVAQIAASIREFGFTNPVLIGGRVMSGATNTLDAVIALDEALDTAARRDTAVMTAEGSELETLRGERLCGLIVLWCQDFEDLHWTREMLRRAPCVPDITIDAIASADAVTSDSAAAIRFAGLDYGRNDDELRAARQFLRAAAIAGVPITGGR